MFNLALRQDSEFSREGNFPFVVDFSGFTTDLIFTSARQERSSVSKLCIMSSETESTSHSEASQIGSEEVEEYLAIENNNDNIHLKVGGLWFILDPKTALEFRSNVLISLIGDAFNSQKEYTGRPITVVVDEADHECFTYFVQMARYGTLPISVLTSQEKLNKLIEQAIFWDIPTEAVTSILSIAKGEVLALFMHFEGILLKEQVAQSESLSHQWHHNYRRDDGGDVYFGTYCTQCEYSERKVVFLDGEKYSECVRCQQEILYKAHLGWCHKCHCCVNCQPEHCPENESTSSANENLSTLSMLVKLEEKVKALKELIN